MKAVVYQRDLLGKDRVRSQIKTSVGKMVEYSGITEPMVALWWAWGFFQLFSLLISHGMTFSVLVLRPPLTSDISSVEQTRMTEPTKEIRRKRESNSFNDCYAFWCFLCLWASCSSEAMCSSHFDRLTTKQSRIIWIAIVLLVLNFLSLLIYKH